MTILEISVKNTADGPTCDKCGAKTRLFGTEMDRYDQLYLLTYVCTGCETLRVDSVLAPPTRIMVPTHQTSLPMSELVADGSFDAETTSLLGAAFDVAWQTLQASGSDVADKLKAGVTRLLLAKSIVAAASHGEREMSRLVQGALTLVSKSA